MIRAEWGGVPDPALLTEHSRKELAEAGDLSGLGNTVCSYYDDDKFLLALTITRPANFLDPAEIFLVVGKDFSAHYARHARNFIAEVSKRFCGLRTVVNVDFRSGCRFAEFLGFRSRGEPFMLRDRRFQLYEVF